MTATTNAITGFSVWHNARLAGFPIGLGLTSVLVGGTLNRVMIAELGLPASLVGLFFAVPLLVSPARAWLGYRSDAFPIGGLRREPYIVLGWFAAALGIVGAVWFTLHGGRETAVFLLATFFSFVLYGLGKNLASNTFEALLADKFEGDQRPRAVTFFKVAMFIGIMGGAIGLGKLLDPFSIAKLWQIVLGVAGLSAVLAVLASVRQEPRTREVKEAAENAHAVSFWETFRRIIWHNRQARLFFIFIMLTTVGTLAQDVLLEPYGALALGMSVADTTRLTALWGGGTILAMMVAGAWLIKKIGYVPVLRIGLTLNVLVFIGIVTAGAIGSVVLFQILVFVLGLGTGLAAAGSLTAVIEFTTLAHAGFFMGVWGIAHELGQAMGSLLGGGVVDAVRLLVTDNPLVTYGTVFTAEAGLLLVGLAVLAHMDMAAWREAVVATEAIGD
ncbi:MAG: BCD family MFS transporter [Chloroflexi bacterium]|nr:BCD family MFS transporter [Chloroflexota bacterium]